MPAPRFPRWVWVLCGLAFLSCLLCCGVGLLPPTTWETIGPIQVLGSPNEVWVFAEKTVVFRSSSLFASAPITTNGRNQQVIVFDRNGEKARFHIPAGVTFNKNLSRILRYNDDFYLIEAPYRPSNSRMFRWKGDHFELLENEESEAWLVQVGLSTVMHSDVDSTIGKVDSAIDKMMKSQGWKRLFDEYEECVGFEEYAKMDGQGWHLKWQVERSTLHALSIASTDMSPPVKIELYTFDPRLRYVTRRERDDILNGSGSGSPRP